ncbi:succinate dehydrogenase iron-sulfur subunit [Caminibacter mediatlanticus TB-2]|uniref:Fumarate reductase iron-sulfur subunit n=1 Tax=Caminibacter mediatlanticus TB-2 TaxID=391592 RepID=A0AAI9AIT0_9BACT|nr:succinate dehydrogenase iron-sulfur subunit [Caminibacter mediatlanticus]EDM24277.1 Succinate dehydrogenase/fumarate reductase iron-sulfur protein [Caminibacter mediatlanticus TB-2]QCT94923.1 succinate dehydrogenase iron-sulfur subunit [Caminibacter mediatlanticus TB-2]
MKIRVKVLRFNKEVDSKPYYKTYELEVDESAVVLDVLDKIKWKFDGSLTYRRSCRHGICGSCGIKVNKKNVLACKTRVKDMVEKFGPTLLIEPLSLKVPQIIKDLVIDKRDFWEDEKRIKPYLIAAIDEHPKMEHLVTPKEVEKLEEAENCIACGCCYYECESKSENRDFIGPMALAKAYKFVADVRDRAKKERLEIVDELGSGVWDCVKCQACIEVCPKDVDPFTKITHLHNEIFEEGVAKKNVATKHAEGFVHSIKKHGILDEGMLVLYSEGVNVVRHMPEAIAMFKKGKIKLPWQMPKSEGLEEIQKLIEISQTHELKG